MWGAAPGKELFQTKVKIHKRLFALLLVFALIIGMIPSALADNEPDISAVESTKEALVDSQSEEEPIISPLIQSILELDEAADDSEVDTEIEAPTSTDGETLTRMDNGGVMLLGGGGTMGKSTCVTFAAYQSARWKCHRYEVDGSHSYGHYFYTSEIAYHTIDGVDSFCIEPNTSSLNGQYYTSYTADEASSSSYWLLELDDLQRSHIQKILAFGYPQVDYGYSRQVQYAATQVLIWEVVSHSRYNADIKSCTDYGLYRNVYAVLGADFQSCYDGILNAISVSDGTVPSFAGTSQGSAKSITLTLNNSNGCYEGSVRDTAGVLSHFTFSASGVNFSRSGNTFVEKAKIQIKVLTKQRTILNVQRKKRQPLFQALAEEETLAPAKRLYDQGHSGMEQEAQRYMEAVKLLDGCGESREELSRQQAELYTKLADLNRELRQVRKQIKMCEKIRAQATVMQENIQNIEHPEQEVTKHHDKQR